MKYRKVNNNFDILKPKYGSCDDHIHFALLYTFRRDNKLEIPSTLHCFPDNSNAHCGELTDDVINDQSRTLHIGMTKCTLSKYGHDYVSLGRGISHACR